MSGASRTRLKPAFRLLFLRRTPPAPRPAPSAFLNFFMLFYPFKIFNFNFKTFNLLLFGFFAKQAAAPELPLYRQLMADEQGGTQAGQGEGANGAAGCLSL
jgi:hypothetical protein